LKHSVVKILAPHVLRVC